MADLRQQRAMIWGAMRNLMLQATSNGGVMSEGQVAAFDQLFTDLHEVDSRIRMGDSGVEVEPLPETPALFISAGYISGGTITASPVTFAPVCICGYDTECPVWCGDGHETGECNSARGYHALPARGIAGRKTKMADNYEYYKELYATTGDEDAYAKMLDCVTME